MFLTNKYLKWYNCLIERSQHRNVETGYEIHHIIPKSMGGSNNKQNLVKLTYREHFVAHLLLWKIAKSTDHQIKMAHAIFMMCRGQYRPIKSSRIFESVKTDMKKRKIVAAGKVVVIDNDNKRFRVETNDERIKTGELRVYSGVRQHKPHTDETKNKCRINKIGSNNPNHKGHIHTPMGVFESAGLAVEKVGLTRGSILKRCHNPNFPDWFIIPLRSPETPNEV